MVSYQKKEEVTIVIRLQLADNLYECCLCAQLIIKFEANFYKREQCIWRCYLYCYFVSVSALSFKCKIIQVHSVHIGMWPIKCPLSLNMCCDSNQMGPIDFPLQIRVSRASTVGQNMHVATNYINRMLWEAFLTERGTVTHYNITAKTRKQQQISNQGICHGANAVTKFSAPR